MATIRKRAPASKARANADRARKKAVLRGRIAESRMKRMEMADKEKVMRSEIRRM